MNPSTGKDHPEHSGSPVYRKVSVHGNQGVSVAVIIKVRRGKVAMSIDPPFTWEAIMEPNKVDELIRTLHQAAADARKMVGGTA